MLCTWHWPVHNKSHQFYLGLGLLIGLCGIALLWAGLPAKVSAGAACHCVMHTWHQHGWEKKQSCKRASCDSGHSSFPQEAGTQPRSQLFLVSLLSWTCSSWQQQLQALSCSHLLGRLCSLGLLSLCWISYRQMEHGTKISVVTGLHPGSGPEAVEVSLRG